MIVLRVVKLLFLDDRFISLSDTSNVLKISPRIWSFVNNETLRERSPQTTGNF